MATPAFARRFIAGETVEEAIAAARAIEARGLLQTLDYLGESVASLAEAEAATRDYLRVVEAVTQAGIIRNLSLKLTQLGLDVDRASAVDNLRRILSGPRGSSSESTWRAPPTRRSRSTSSRCSGSRATATSAWCCRPTCIRTEADEARISRARRARSAW